MTIALLGVRPTKQAKQHQCLGNGKIGPDNLPSFETLSPGNYPHQGILLFSTATGSLFTLCSYYKPVIEWMDIIFFFCASSSPPLLSPASQYINLTKSMKTVLLMFAYVAIQRTLLSSGELFVNRSVRNKMSRKEREISRSLFLFHLVRSVRLLPIWSDRNWNYSPSIRSGGQGNAAM